MGDNLDEAIRAAYHEWHVPLDSILIDPRSAMRFAKEIRGKSPKLSAMDDPTILGRAIALRKRGVERGGLGPLRY